MCGIEGCSVSARFDTGKVEEFPADTASDGSSNVLFVNDENHFVRGLLASEKVVVEVEFYNAGTQQLVFSTRGLKWPEPEPDSE